VTPNSSVPRARGALRRGLAASAVFLVATALVLAVPGSASAAPTTSRADAAAGWLGRQLTAQHLISGQFGADYGLTADVVLALDSAGVGRKAARQATAALTRHVVDYTGGGDPTEFYAGSFAKLLNVAAAAGTRPNEFGTAPRHKLAFQLLRLECGGTRARVCPTGNRGRFSDESKFGDFSNTITQSLALTGLQRTTKAGPSAASVRYLRNQQCRNGAFPLEISTAGCVASVDATAFAVQALLEVGGRKATAAAARAATWLTRQQNKNGSFTGNGVRNTNTTGLAAQALDAAGRGAAAARAVRFITDLQVGCGGKPANRGKVRYDRKGSGDALRATAQAVPAMAGTAFADITAAGATRTLPRLAC
jgi:hypothetical protein